MAKPVTFPVPTTAELADFTSGNKVRAIKAYRARAAQTHGDYTVTPTLPAVRDILTWEASMGLGIPVCATAENARWKWR